MTTEQLISLPVVSIYDQKQIGIITNVLVSSSHKITALVVVDEEEYNTYILFTKDIFALGQAMALIKNSSVMHLKSSVELKISKLYSPVRQIVVSTDGNYYGQITNIEFDSSYVLNKISTIDNAFDANLVNLCPQMVVISAYKFNVNKFKPNTKISLNSIPANLPTVNIVSSQVVPKREVANYSYLVGRTTTKDIVNINGEVVVKENTKINSFVLDKVKNFGKLKELAINSKA